MNNQKKSVLAIISYLIIIKLFAILYSLIQYLGVINDLSKVFYYVTSIVIVIALLPVFKMIFKFGQNLLGKKLAIYIFAIAVVAMVTMDQLLAYNLGVKIGRTIDDMKILVAPREVMGHVYIGLHMALLFSYKWIFKENN